MGDRIKDRLGSSLSVFNRFRFQVSHASIIAYSALFLVLFIAFMVRILALRWENLSTGPILLNEFDPYYQYSITKHMVDNGGILGLLSPYYPTHWINFQKWYPDGLDMSTSLPALPMTATVLYSIVSVFGQVDLMTFCSILPALIAVVSCLVVYFIGKDMGGRTVGLFSALFLALAPSFLQRSSLGFFDTEVPGVLGLVLFIFLFLRSIDNKRSQRGSIFYSLGAGAALAYFISGWGAAYYLLVLSVLFVFILVLLKRYSQRLLINYSITFGLALFIATKVPYIGLGYLTSGAVIPVVAVFIVLIIAELLRHNIATRTKFLLTGVSIGVIVGGFVTLWATGILSRSGIQGKFITVLDPFIRATSPLIDSVAEQRISTWGNVYIELGISILFFIVGLYFTLKNPTNRNIFLLLFATTSLYFATSMVRLLVLFAPAFAIIASIGIFSLIKPFYTLLRESSRNLAKSKRRMARVSKEYSGVAIFLIFIILMTSFAFSPQTGNVRGQEFIPRPISQAYVPTAISSSSLPIGGAGLNQPVVSWLDAINYLKTSGTVTSSDAVVMWWDYGNWLADLGNVTSLADNTTVNSTQIENVGYIFMANENQSMAMLSNYGPAHTKYIAVFTVLQAAQQNDGSYVVGPSGYGDEGKWTWMARISGQAKDRFIQEGYMTSSNAWTDESSFGSVVSNQQTGQSQWQWNDRGLNCTVFELMNYAEQRYAQTQTQSGVKVTPDQTTTLPTYFKEAYFSGLNVVPTTYGGLIPIVAIYSIDWTTYYAAQGIG